MIISDPKGEIYNDNSGIMRELGYQIIILNFRDPQKGNCWNPYHLPSFFAGGLQGVWSLMKTDTDKAADQQGENYGTDNITFSYKPG